MDNLYMVSERGLPKIKQTRKLINAVTMISDSARQGHKDVILEPALNDPRSKATGKFFLSTLASPTLLAPFPRYPQVAIGTNSAI
jgi:hypothetical protein